MPRIRSIKQLLNKFSPKVMPEDLPIVHSDAHLLVVDKPAGLLAQSDYSGAPDVLTKVREAIRDDAVRLVHRLDRPTSGLMVLARSRLAAAHLSEQFRERHAEKRYLAVVEEAWEGWGEAVDYLAQERERSRVVESTHPDAQRAALTWRVIASESSAAAEARLSLVDVLLQTGRQHQIRVQMAARGHPVWGDERYGAERTCPGKGIALHAFQLAVEHPERRRLMRWQVGPPSAWAARFATVIERLST